MATLFFTTLLFIVLSFLIGHFRYSAVEEIDDRGMRKLVFYQRYSWLLAVFLAEIFAGITMWLYIQKENWRLFLYREYSEVGFISLFFVCVVVLCGWYYLISAIGVLHYKCVTEYDYNN